uniref:Uncharacterized protein n=1 Tax=Equus caballus TaxID=9796 RepID=A0A9L0TEN1_HORSE
MKRPTVEWERIFANHIADKRLIPKIYKELTQLNSKNKKKKKNTSKKWAEDLNRHFSKEDIQKANGYMKRGSTLLITKKMQIKTTMRYHLTLLEWLLLKRQEITNAGKNMEKRGTLVHCWWECKLVQRLRKIVWRFLKKLKIELPYDPAIPLLGIHSKEMKSIS